MQETPEFPELLRLIDERAAALGATVLSASSLELPVPTCPGWSLRDLVQHLGTGNHRWAATVAAGPADAPPAESTWRGTCTPPPEREELLPWFAESTEHLLSALRQAGPDHGCWTWWGRSQAPQTAGAVARHRVQENAVHTYDAQLAVGAAQPLPEGAALDGVEEFLFTCCATTIAWPHAPATVEFHATQGRSWRLRLDAEGARATRLPAVGEDPDAADASARGTASDVVLVLYDRIPLEALRLYGDRRLFELLRAWEPEE